jgi:mannose/fructose/N-acetylgalactosamine-specific phosphotransferase system component IIC
MNGGHRNGAAPPIGTLVQVLPNVFDLVRVAANQARNHVLREITRNGQFTAIERCITNTAQAFICLYFQGEKVAQVSTQ